MKLLNMPLIKWTGSKRKQAKQIVDLFPKNINTYYEPFLGGGSVLHELLHRVINKEIEVKSIVCSDINKELINFWNIFINDKDKLFAYYTNQYNKLVSLAEVDKTPDAIEQIKKCQIFYYSERKRFNYMTDDNPEKPYLFFWLSRTAFNGLIRYNKKGEFNSPFHVGGRFGISPEKLKIVFDEWHECLSKINIIFYNESYDEVIKSTKEGDIVYMDPPYINTTGMYFTEGFDINHCYEELNKLNNKNVKWLMSMDGISGEKNLTLNVPKIYKRHLYISSGQSNFRKLAKIDVSEVLESLYISYE